MSIESAEPPSEERVAASVSAESLAVQLLEDADVEFFDRLRAVGLLRGLDADELLRVASELDEEGDDDEARQVDLLEIYYDAEGDPARSRTRRTEDRFFIQRAGDPATAAGLVERLAALTPELREVTLERFGGTDDGPLVVRSGDDFSGVLDDYEEETDSAELAMDHGKTRETAIPMVTVRGLVHAINVLLNRNGVRERLVPLSGDHEREVYVGVGVAEAIQLAQDGLLEDDDVESVMMHAAW